MLDHLAQAVGGASHRDVRDLPERIDFAVKLQQTHPRLPVVLAIGYAELPTHTAIEFRRLAKTYSRADLAAALEAAVNQRR
jgi:hypothetical protein